MQKYYTEIQYKDGTFKEIISEGTDGKSVCEACFRTFSENNSAPAWAITCLYDSYVESTRIYNEAVRDGLWVG